MDVFHSFSMLAEDKKKVLKIVNAYAMWPLTCCSLAQRAFQRYFLKHNWKETIQCWPIDALSSLRNAALDMQNMDDLDLVELAMSVEYEVKICLKKLGVIVTASPLPALLAQKSTPSSPLPQVIGSRNLGAPLQAPSSSQHRTALKELMEATEALKLNKTSVSDTLVEWPDVGGLLQELYKARGSLQGEALEAVEAVINALHISLDSCRGL